MRHSTLTLCVLCLVISACEPQSTGDDNTDATLDSHPYDQGSQDTDMGNDWSEHGNDTGVYRYVLILDTNEGDGSNPTHTAGVDLYGAQLERSGIVFDATQLHGCGLGAGDNELAMDCYQILGPPDNACNPTDTSPPFVSLGGQGGWIIVSFGDMEEFAAGDIITIFECGSGSSFINEFYDVYIGNSPSYTDPNWVECVRGATGESVCNRLPDIPVEPVCELDGICEPLCVAGTDPDCPGCEFDSVCNPRCHEIIDPDCE